MNVWSAIWMIFAVLLVVMFIPSVCLFWKHSTSIQITNRSFWSVTVSVFALVSFGVIGSVGDAFQDQAPCAQIIVPKNFFLYLHMFFLIERCVLLIILYQIAVQAQTYASRQHKNLDIAASTATADEMLQITADHGHEVARSHEGWLLKNRAMFHHGLFSRSKLTAFTATLIALLDLIGITMSHPDEATSPLNSKECLSLGSRVSYLSFVVLIFAVVVLAECGRRISKVKENFRIKQELRDLLITGCACVLWVTASWISPQVKDSQPDIAFYVVIPLAEVLISMLRVVKLVRDESRSTRRLTRAESSQGGKPQTSTSVPVSPVAATHADSAANSTVLTTSSSGNTPAQKKPGRKTHHDRLTEVLSDPLLTSAFEQFMVQEFAIENLYFLKAVEKFEMMCSTNSRDELLQENAKVIYSRFCAEKAKLAVNISSSVQRQLKASLGDQSEVSKINHEVFSAAKKEIVDLVCMDSLRRFLNSPAFTACQND
eukprot:TRINITY_DN1238_c0_g1_i1.p1 TRINITY_DN1238_c0_g1~~TRINITY_DN1238_c0_g1_i1.p1  ORF type:complete len:487 (-),score=95.32 TRINITY_DN1238_c0_g1_i1:888-2348(-)